MQIHGPAHVHGPQPVNPPHASPATQSTAPPTSVAGGDQLDISETAQAIAGVSDIADIRQDRVAEIRAKIAQGVYETDDKLDVALDRLLDEIG